MFLALALCAWIPPDVHIVDDDPGAPAEFNTIQGAIDAAQDGDTILVRAGSYEHFVIDGKELAVVGVPEDGVLPFFWSEPFFNPPTLVKNVAADQEVTIRGFEASAPIRVESCAGPVLLEDIRGATRVEAASCEDVMLARCTLQSGPGILASDSTLHAWELDISNDEFEGWDGISLSNSFLFLAGSVVKGADGAGGASGLFCSDGGAGGDGLQLVSSTCYSLDNVFEGGGGGAPGIGKLIGPCSTGAPGLDVKGPGLVALTGTSHELELSSPGIEGDSVHLRVAGASGEFVYAIFSTALSPQWFPAYGTLAVSPFSNLLFLGVLGASGVLEADVAVGELGPGLESVRLVLQGIFVHPTGSDYFGSATSVELLDRDIFLVDCNGNGIDDVLDVASGTSLDVNGNGQPDECDVTLIVPDAYPTIQAAVDAAAHKNIVLVRPGTYSGPGFQDVVVMGKDVTIVSEMGAAATVIDLATAIVYGIRFGGSETLQPVPDTAGIRGFTFRNHDGLQSPVMIYDSGATIADCVFEDNQGNGGWSGAISVFESPYSPEPPHTLRIERCVFRRNVQGIFGSGQGGALRVTSGAQGNYRLVLENSLFEENEAKVGGALYVDEVDLDVRNCQFHANRASVTASALFWELDWDSNPVPARHVSILGSTFHGNVCTAPNAPALVFEGDLVPSATMSARNSIFWGNTNPGTSQIQVSTTTHVAANVAWCTVQGGLAGWSGPVTVGPGNSVADPLFVNPAAGDLHLGPGSPCRDAGDPAFVSLAGELDLDGEPRVFGPAVDQGADEDQP